jgi:hypothetical protein
MNGIDLPSALGVGAAKPKAAIERTAATTVVNFISNSVVI